MVQYHYASATRNYPLEVDLSIDALCGVGMWHAAGTNAHRGQKAFIDP